MQKQYKPLSNIEISSFCSQMALILQSGISAIEGATIMMEDADSSDEKAILTVIHEELSESGNFYQSLEKSGVFPLYLLNMVKLGEETGKLDDVMAALADHYQREDNIQKSIKNAVTYPLAMITMMVLVILVLLTRVMPIFNQVFIQLGHEMTGFSKGILNLGTTINRYSLVFIGVFVLLAVLGLYLVRNKTLRQSIGYHLKFSRLIYERIAAGRFASGMALTLSSGLNPDQCLELVGGLIENMRFQKKVDQCREKVSEGDDISAALIEAKIFTGMHGRMTSIGAKTGALDDVMKRIADQFEEEIDTDINHLISIMEPTLVIALSVVVGIILLSVMLPLMGIMSSL